MRLITYFRQRLADWRRERRIACLAEAARLHMEAGQYGLAREALQVYMAERGKRSDAQLTRLAIAELRRCPELARKQIEIAERGGRDA